jgi:hypothetical protein
LGCSVECEIESSEEFSEEFSKEHSLEWSIGDDFEGWEENEEDLSGNEVLLEINTYICKHLYTCLYVHIFMCICMII